MYTVCSRSIIKAQNSGRTNSWLSNAKMLMNIGSQITTLNIEFDDFWKPVIDTI